MAEPRELRPLWFRCLRELKLANSWRTDAIAYRGHQHIAGSFALWTTSAGASAPSHRHRSFAASVDEITRIVTSYPVATGVSIPLGGWIAARLGRKRYFIVSVVLLVIGSARSAGVAGNLGRDGGVWYYAGCRGRRNDAVVAGDLAGAFPPAEHTRTLAMSTFGEWYTPLSCSPSGANLQLPRPGRRQLLRGRPRRPRVLGAGCSSSSSGSTSNADSEDTTVRSSGVSRSRSSASTSAISGGGVH